MSVKQVIVMRKDLGMNKGKLMAQANHAALGAFLNAMMGVEKPFIGVSDDIHVDVTIQKGTPLHEWLVQSFTKVTLAVHSEAELLELYTKAKEQNTPCALILDEGRTVFNTPTYTGLGIGPDSSESIDKITGHLSLY